MPGYHASKIAAAFSWMRGKASGRPLNKSPPTGLPVAATASKSSVDGRAGRCRFDCRLHRSFQRFAHRQHHHVRALASLTASTISPSLKGRSSMARNH